MESVELDMEGIMDDGPDEDVGAVGALPDLPEATQGEEEEDNVEVLARLKDLSKGAAKKIVRRPQPKLDSDRLTGERGIPILTKVFKNIKFKGKGHEAMVLGVLIEHSLPLTKAPVLVDLAKSLGKDQKALSKLELSRTAASNKITHGMGRSVKNDLVADLRKSPFSLNIDEATSANNKKVLTILASYYCEAQGKVVVAHLDSVEVFKVTSQNVYQQIETIMESNNIPWLNLTSVLMDSCNVMRGSRTGVEVRLREKAPHLLGVDGDSCHHIHNCCKQFCKPFGYWLEGLFGDLHTDFKWSSDLKQLLEELCEFLGVKYSVPERFVSHRWLSAHDLALSTSRILDVLKVLYYAFLSKDDKITYLSIVVDIYKQRKVSPEARDRIRKIWVELANKKKSMTSEGKARKERIVEKILFQYMKTQLQLNLYGAGLSLLKDYVMVFQRSDTLVQELHIEQLETFKRFCSNFIKAEEIVSKSPKQLKAFNFCADNEQFLSTKQMFVGKKNDDLIKQVGHKDKNVVTFLEQTLTAYTKCAEHMKKTLPLDSKVLQALASLDPSLRGNSVCATEMRSLVGLFSHRFTEEEMEEAEREVRHFNVDSRLPGFTNGSDIVQWWASVKGYPHLKRVALAAVSVFHGPQVESSFNVMKDIIGTGSANTHIKTYSAIQTVKYHLRAQNKSATDFFRRDDPVFSPVNLKMCRSVRGAASLHKKELEEKTKEKISRQEQYKTVPVSEQKTKQQEIKEKEELEKKAHMEHINRERKRAKKGHWKSLLSRGEKSRNRVNLRHL